MDSRVQQCWPAGSHLHPSQMVWGSEQWGWLGSANASWFPQHGQAKTPTFLNESRQSNSTFKAASRMSATPKDIKNMKHRFKGKSITLGLYAACQIQCKSWDDWVRSQLSRCPLLRRIRLKVEINLLGYNPGGSMVQRTSLKVQILLLLVMLMSLPVDLVL